MKTFLPIFIAIFISATGCNAQTTERPKHNVVSFEIGKTGLIYNLAFDHKSATKNVGFRVAGGSNFAKYLNVVTIGAGSYYLVGQVKHYFELGIEVQYLAVDEVSDDQKGITLVYPNYSLKTIYPNINLGYRVYGKQTLFRMGISPALIQGDFVPGGYISYGFRF